MKQKSKKPNIVFMLSDDQGAWAMGCAGNDEIRTPNLDRLAESGIRFENFFCTSPVCSPARASLFTGKMPSQHGVHDWISGGNTGEHAIEYLAGQTGLTDILAEHGYECGISGKWHLGDSQTPQKSFKHWFVHEKGGGPYYGARMVRNGELVVEEDYLTDVITDDGIQFIKEHAHGENPFYLSVHYTAPHDPWIGQHPEDIVALYDDCLFESCPQEPLHPWTIPTAPGRDQPREHLKGYFAAVTAMDANIGRIIDTLEEEGIRNDTLIVFLSDNGFNCGHHGIWGKGNGTFPQNMYDTSVKVPAIMSHPGTIVEHIVSDELVSGYDVLPTLLDYLGLMHFTPEHLPGRSISPVLQGDAIEERDNVVIYDEYGPVRMIRTKEWKYIHRYPYGPHELYDLIDDPGERHNRIDDTDCEQIVKQMRGDLEEWFYTYADAAIDGTRQPVSGLGQIGLAGINGKGKKAFVDPK
ncbi:sulfatase-like hydrolase/transferase [Lentibacillus saliphilus]|uniref:sulfatase-like hydrolase/transferase n=1 Tax=Lentibacillus saliphilus TaxID=2737028 RepID=UPI001FE54C94|nr:sulfatase-like hydrolase/transferase [Lentibacillus saliphilus]